MDNSYLYEYFKKEERIKQKEVYVVQDKDTLYKIANSLGVDLVDLIEVNNLTNYLIYPNQVLVIPKAEENNGMYFEEYSTKQNDTLDQIAMMFNTEISEIIKYNDLGKLQLLGGQELKISKKLKSYQIVETDTLDYILKKTNMDAYELLKLNFKNLMSPGVIIYIK